MSDEEKYDQEAEEEQPQSLSEVMQKTKQAYKLLIQDITTLKPHLDSESDLDVIKQAEEIIGDKHTARDLAQEKIEQDIKALQTALSEARKAALRPSTAGTEEEHESLLSRLEADQLAKGKQVNDQHHAATKKVEELERLRGELERLAAWDVEKDDEDGAGEKFARALRLQMIRDAGFQLVPKTDDHPERLLIRNDIKEDVHVVPIDKDKSRFYHANLFWNLASE